MNIQVKHFKIHEVNDAGEEKTTPGISVFVEGDTVKAFQELIQKGANLWDQAPAEIKTLADLITNGKEMQPYSDINT
jgi:hypothetical protein